MKAIILYYLFSDETQPIPSLLVDSIKSYARILPDKYFLITNKNREVFAKIIPHIEVVHPDHLFESNDFTLLSELFDCWNDQSIKLSANCPPIEIHCFARWLASRRLADIHSFDDEDLILFHDWDDIFECLNSIKEEIRENFPYKVLEVYGAEADDIIAALCGELESNSDKTLILSGDKDFVQLQKYSNVTQYSPITKKFVNGIDPSEYLHEHILKGDTSDGVPNVLSPDNTFVDGLRQRPLSKKKIAQWAGPMCEHQLPNDEIKRNYQRNKKLIDLTQSPPELHLECIEEYKNAKEGDRSKLLNYFIKNRLQELMNSIGDF